MSRTSEWESDEARGKGISDEGKGLGRGTEPSVSTLGSSTVFCVAGGREVYGKAPGAGA